MMPDDVCREYSESGLKLKVTEMDETMLIEGTAESLLFLSKLFSAQSGVMGSIATAPAGIPHPGCPAAPRV